MPRWRSLVQRASLESLYASLNCMTTEGRLSFEDACAGSNLPFSFGKKSASCVKENIIEKWWRNSCSRRLPFLLGNSKKTQVFLSRQKSFALLYEESAEVYDEEHNDAQSASSRTVVYRLCVKKNIIYDRRNR